VIEVGEMKIYWRKSWGCEEWYGYLGWPSVGRGLTFAYIERKPTTLTADDSVIRRQTADYLVRFLAWSSEEATTSNWIREHFALERLLTKVSLGEVKRLAEERLMQYGVEAALDGVELFPKL
jgi:hypothetical protein